MKTLSLWRTMRRPLATFVVPRRRYRPELHYMRGPGPATRAKLRSR